MEVRFLLFTAVHVIPSYIILLPFLCVSFSQHFVFLAESSVQALCNACKQVHGSFIMFLVLWFDCMVEQLQQA